MDDSPFNPLTATASGLQELLTGGKIDSVSIVNACLRQIEQHDGYLKAILATAPGALDAARALDEERRDGWIRGPLHGIPILIKDNVATHPDLRMDTTAGSFALAGSKPRHSALVVDALVKAGAVILAKSQLSEFAFYKGSGLPAGWSAIGGQCQSAYTTDDVQPDDLILGYSSPGGSSTGSAVRVSARYAPIAIGTDTTGSVIIPATGAALYRLRVTPRITSMDGVIPFSRTFDSLGAMAKNVRDLADILTIMIDPTQPGVPREGYASNLEGVWSDLRVGFVAPDKWQWSPKLAKPNRKVELQLIKDTKAAYDRIRGLAKEFHQVELISPNTLEQEGKLGLYDLFRADFKRDLGSYLENLDYSKVRSLEEIVIFNKEHASVELPEGYDRQDLLEAALNYNLSDTSRATLLSEIRSISREQGIDKTIDKYNIDVIIGPADSVFNLLVCGAGYPSATMPLSYLEFNGRPTGVFAIAKANREGTLLKVMSAWEKTFPARKTPSIVK